MESESTLLLPRPLSQLEIPTDRGNFVYGIFYLLGVGTLLPWNFFSNAKQYFMFKLRNTTEPTNMSLYMSPDQLTADNETNLQVMFESYLTLAAMIPNVLFMFLNTAATHLIRLKVRILLAAVVMILMFALTIILTKINTDEWQMKFFGVTLTTIVIMNAGSAVLQGGIFGLSGMFPKQYTQAVMGGMGMGGIIAAVANVLTVAVGSTPVDSGFGYFLCAELVLLLAAVGYLLLPLSRYSRYYMEEMRKRALSASVNTDTDTDYTSSTNTLSGGEASIEAKITGPKHSSLWTVFTKVWMYAISVFITFFITLSCYPSVNSAIVSVYKPVCPDCPWPAKYFMPVSCFLTFNFGDWIGRSIAGPLQWPREGSVLIPIFSFTRIAFIPLFLLCNVQPRHHLPVVFENDVVPIVLMAVFAVTNGYIGTICMMYGPSQVAPEDVETAGSMMSFFLSSGLGFGAVLSVLLIKVI